MKNIILVSLGGTIACSSSEEGLVPKYSPEYLISQEPAIFKIAKVKPTQLMMRTIVYPMDWITIARFITKSMDDFDGFVVTMGTDTLAYASSMLSFMLLGINKPVVVTGAMIPIEKENSDARKNLLDSIILACEQIFGVYVVFNGKVIRGCRASKVSGTRIDAFESINYPEIAKITDGKILYSQISPNQKDNFSLDVKIDTHVADIKLNPQDQPEFFQKFTGYKGFVIEGYGDGNIADNLTSEIIKIIKEKKIVVIASQCTYGEVDHKYKGGYLAIKNGAISAKDMTKESVLTKLMWCLGKTKDPDRVKEMMYKNMCEEIKD